MPAPGEKKCIDGVEYVWSPVQAQPSTSNINAQLSDIIDLLNVIAAKMPGIGVGGGSIYRSVDTNVDARRNDYPVSIGVGAKNLNIRVDQKIKLKLMSTAGDLIEIDPTEAPFEIINFPAPVDEVYVTTGSRSTRVQILAYP